MTGRRQDVDDDVVRMEGLCRSGDRAVVRFELSSLVFFEIVPLRLVRARRKSEYKNVAILGHYPFWCQGGVELRDKYIEMIPAAKKNTTKAARDSAARGLVRLGSGWRGEVRVRPPVPKVISDVQLETQPSGSALWSGSGSCLGRSVRSQCRREPPNPEGASL